MKYYYGLSAALIGVSLALVQPQARGALPAAEVGKVAKKITVLIDSNKNIGSGVIIKRQGNTYYVITAKHVVENRNKYAIVTADGKRHQVNYSSVRKLPELDLAVLQFNSNQEYTVAEYGDSDAATEGTTTYVAGFPKSGASSDRDFQFTEGKVSSRPSRSKPGGYAVYYTNITYSGMSGGPVLDENGHLIGIHGQGQTDDDAVKVGFNLGIPLNGYRDRIAKLIGQPATVASNPEPTPAPQNPLVKYVGAWKGIGTQFDQPSSSHQWSILISLAAGNADSIVGNIAYPSLQCGGKLMLLSLQPNSIELSENLTYGRNNCIDNGIVTLKLKARNTLEFGWYKPNYPSTATGSLTKISPN